MRSYSHVVNVQLKDTYKAARPKAFHWSMLQNRYQSWCISRVQTYSKCHCLSLGKPLKSKKLFCSIRAAQAATFKVSTGLKQTSTPLKVSPDLLHSNICMQTLYTHVAKSRHSFYCDNARVLLHNQRKQPLRFDYQAANSVEKPTQGGRTEENRENRCICRHTHGVVL